MITTVTVRELGQIVMRFDDLTTDEADWIVKTIALVPGRSVNRTEALA